MELVSSLVLYDCIKVIFFAISIVATKVKIERWERGKRVYLMRILMQIWGLCGCSAEDLMEYAPKKTSARKSSTVHISSAHVCRVNLCGLTKIECIYLLSCMVICQVISDNL